MSVQGSSTSEFEPFKFEEIPALIARLKEDLKATIDEHNLKLSEFLKKPSIGGREGLQMLMTSAYSPEINRLATQAFGYERFVRGRFPVISFIVNGLDAKAFDNGEMKEILANRGKKPFHELLDMVLLKLKLEEDAQRWSEEMALITSQLNKLPPDERSKSPLYVTYKEMDKEKSKAEDQAEAIVKEISALGNNYSQLAGLLGIRGMIQKMPQQLSDLSNNLPALIELLPEKMVVESQQSRTTLTESDDFSEVDETAFLQKISQKKQRHVSEDLEEDFDWDSNAEEKVVGKHEEKDEEEEDWDKQFEEEDRQNSKVTSTAEKRSLPHLSLKESLEKKEKKDQDQDKNNPTNDSTGKPNPITRPGS